MAVANWDDEMAWEDVRLLDKLNYFEVSAKRRLRLEARKKRLILIDGQLIQV
jgi:hypothetical protein